MTPDPVLGAAASNVTRARVVAGSTSEFRSIDSAAALEALAGKDMFLATALEAFIECPCKWFFERAMDPLRFGPDPEAIAKGNHREAERAAKYPSLEELMPELYRQLLHAETTLENHFKDMQDLEFTVQSGKLYLLQTRNGKRTGKAAVRIAVEMHAQSEAKPRDARVDRL